MHHTYGINKWKLKTFLYFVFYSINNCGSTLDAFLRDIFHGSIYCIFMAFNRGVYVCIRQKEPKPNKSDKLTTITHLPAGTVRYSQSSSAH